MEKIKSFEFCEGEQARISEVALKDNPYQAFQNQSYNWAKGWCDRDMTAGELAKTKATLDSLHMRKIDLADEVLILNVDGYIGESTARELAYAKAMGKRVRFLESGNGH